MDAFAKQWLNIMRLNAPPSDAALFPVQDPAVVAAAASSEIGTLFTSTLIDRQGTLRDFYSTEDVVASHPWLAGLYATPASNAPARSSAQGRKGLLTRAAFHLHGAHSTYLPLPHRGYNVKVTMLCGTVGEFPNGIDTSLPAFAPETMSSRQYYSVLTDRPECSSCHDGMNPYGYALSGYSVTGVRLVTESVRSRNSNTLMNVPVDEGAAMLVDGTMVSVASPTEMSDAIGRSKEGMACFAYRFNQFAVGWKEAPHCGIAAAFRALSQGMGRFEDAIVAYVTSPTFRRR